MGFNGERLSPLGRAVARGTARIQSGWLDELGPAPASPAEPPPVRPAPAPPEPAPPPRRTAESKRWAAEQAAQFRAKAEAEREAEARRRAR
jgi:hypothetical protein